ncbi:SDR family oxidoreductase [Actinosynnema pretiosum subsp. pretiosum]|uniref:NAD-dependent epimerase/dehydratase n=2 Tax=Actinosynnema TaxID=40566 RepID=C6WCI2_ACTMD|nr:NAD(P)-binding oxidoreductase [Actinosynnema mirum]ACU34003.1 NAD-dependent epimerase/dehydratase [Actinosynnema mirum DSM 43827]QUF01879.1 SDR family oxidoreductase [Actinosynnema pretiosum subsp. pretiosum]
MRLVIAGGHGKIALHVQRLLAAGGDAATALVRNEDHFADVTEAGGVPVLCDLEASDVASVAEYLTGADAVLFAAGAGPGSGVGRKDSVDRGASALLADAAERAGVRRFVQISSAGIGRTTGDEVFDAYLLAKGAAEEDLKARDLDWTIVRPGRLTDEPATGAVRLTEGDAQDGSVPRADVAAVVVAVLAQPSSVGKTYELISGETPVQDAI